MLIKQTRLLMAKPAEQLPLSFACHHSLVEWSEDDTSRFLATVKASGATVGKVLMGAAMLATYRHIQSSPTAQRSSDPKSRMPGGAAIDQRPNAPAHAAESMLSNPTVICPDEEELSAAQTRLKSGSFGPADLVMPHTAAWLRFHQAYGFWPAIRATAAVEDDTLAQFAAGDRAMPSYSFLGRLDPVLKATYGALDVTHPRFAAHLQGPYAIYYGTTHRGRLLLWIRGQKSHLSNGVTKGLFDDFNGLLRGCVGLAP